MRPDGKLLALEATPLTFRAPQATITADGLLSRVDMRQTAGADAGECLHNLRPISGQELSHFLSGHRQRIDHRYRHNAGSLSSPGTNVDLIKIDAEGAEFTALQGMMRILSESPDIVVVLRFSATHWGRADASPSEFIDFMAADHLVAFLLDDAKATDHCRIWR